MGVLFFALTVLVLPGLPAGAQVGRWGLLAIASSVLLFHVKQLGWQAWALVAYLGLMTWGAPNGYDALYLYFHACFFIVLYAYAKQLTDLRRIAIGLALGFTVNSLMVLAQEFGNGGAYIPQLTLDAGLFFNRNVATEGAALALILAVGYRLWWLIPGIVPSLVWGSRAPMVALGGAFFLMAWSKSKLLAIGALAICLGIAWFWLQKHGDSLSGVDAEGHPYLAGVFDTLYQRFGVWADGAQGFTVFGRGLGSWLSEFPLYQRHSSPLQLRWENAHNDAVQIVFELGAVGAGLIALFIARLATAVRNPAFYALVVFAIESLFEFPLYNPVTGAVAAVCAGFLFSRSPRLYASLAGLGLRIRAWYTLARRYGVLPIRQSVPADA